MGRMQAGVPTPEEISRLMDGELDAGRVELSVRGCNIPSVWRVGCVYHVIGDTMRGSGAHPAGEGAAGTSVPASRLALPIVWPRSRRYWLRRAKALRPGAACSRAGDRGDSCCGQRRWLGRVDDDACRRRWPLQAPSRRRRCAATDARRAVDDEYLLAHQEYSPTTAIQGVRPVPARGRGRRVGCSSVSSSPSARNASARCGHTSAAAPASPRSRCLSSPVAYGQEAADWLQRAATAAQQLNYVGTVVYQHAGRVETSRLVASVRQQRRVRATFQSRWTGARSRSQR